MERRAVRRAREVLPMAIFDLPVLRTTGAAVGLAAVAACGDAGEPSAPAVWRPEAVETPAAVGSGQPNLTVAPNGEVLLSWTEALPGEEGHRLVFSRLEAEGWSAPGEIARGGDWFVNWADFPGLLALDNGRLAAHYLQRHPGAARGYHYDVRVVQSADGGRTWSGAVSPHRAGVPAEYGFVSYFPEPDGEVGLIWLDGRQYDAAFGATGEMSLRATTLGAEGGLGAEVVLDGRICDCCQTSAALTDRGPVVVYRDRTEAEVRDISILRRIDGRWSEPATVYPDGWVIPACPVNGPFVAARGSDVAVAWYTGAADTARVRLAFSRDAGENFTPAVRVDDGDPVGRAAAALLPDGDAVVIWLERSDGDLADLRYRRVAPDGETRSTGTVATTAATRASGFPRIALAGDLLVLAWTAVDPEPMVKSALIRLEDGR